VLVEENVTPASELFIVLTNSPTQTVCAERLKSLVGGSPTLIALLALGCGRAQGFCVVTVAENALGVLKMLVAPQLEL
jgi:hypothetical protein